MVKFVIITRIQMEYTWIVTYNWHTSDSIEKCTQDEIDTYFQV